MTVDVIKNFVETYKDFVIQIRLDNQILVYDNVPNYPPVIWNWDEENFMLIEPNDEMIDQSGHPMQIRLVDFGDIQELIAYVDTNTALNFINENITDEDKNKQMKELLSKVKGGLMTPRSLRKPAAPVPAQVNRVTINNN